MRSIYVLLIITLIIYRCDNSVPCDLLYGGCKHSLEPATAFIQPIAAQPISIAHHSFYYPPTAHQPQLYQPPPTQQHQQHQQHQQQQQPLQFLAAPPGKVPRCAKPGTTFCEKIDRYPGDLIQTLAAKTKYNFRSLFADETGEGFNKKSLHQGGSGGAGGYSQQGNVAGGTGKSPTTNFQVNAHFQQPNQYFSGFDTFSANFTQPQQQQRNPHTATYPDRQYPLQDTATHLVDPVLYASFVQPSVDVTPYNPSDWWKRTDPPDEKTKDSPKRKRQSSLTPSGSELCPSISQFIMPKAALNSRGQWKYVVNVDQGNEKYTQLVRSETCLTDKCSGICSLPNGYTSKCEQKYVQKRLVALDGSGTTLETELFWFPHCCVCQIAPDITYK